MVVPVCRGGNMAGTVTPVDDPGVVVVVVVALVLVFVSEEV